MGAALLLGAAAPASAAPNRITFTAQPGVATLVAHYTVTPGQRAGFGPSQAMAAAADGSDQLPELDPKAFGPSRFARPLSTTVGSNTQNPNAGPGGTPRTTASFIGQQGSNITCSYFAHGCNPPDMAIAASRTRVLQGVNTQWEVLDTSGNVRPGWPVSAQSFFGVPSNTCDPSSNGQPFLSDPRAIYDPNDGRFWAAMLQVEGGLGIAPGCPLKTVYYIAVSQTGDPSGSWNVYEFEMSMGAQFAADFTQIGLDGQAVYFSANMFGLTSGFYAEIFEANKGQMERGQANFTADGFFNLQAHGPGGDFLADTVQPVLNLDGTNDGRFLDTFDGPDPITGNLCSSPIDGCTGLAVWRMGNPIGHDRGGPAPTLSATRVGTLPFAFPPPADQPTCTECIDANDLRIGATPVELNGVIYAAWGTAIDNGTQVVPGIEWAQFQPTGGGATQVRSGYFNFSGDVAATYPVVMPTVGGGLTMLYDRMGSTINPETRFIVRSDGGQFTGAGRLLKAGEAPYRPTLCGTAALPVCRWGDYSAASFDGSSRIWLAGQYANPFIDPNVAPQFGRNWGTWIGAIRN